MSLPPIPSAWPSNRRRGPALADVSPLRIDSGEITDRVKAFPMGLDRALGPAQRVGDLLVSLAAWRKCKSNPWRNLALAERVGVLASAAGQTS